MPLLTVHGLTKTFGKTTAVDGLSFSVKGGEIVGLLGPNGAGKSTTFLSLAGLIRPDAGSITWDGRELGSERGRTVSLIPETPDVYPMLTVWEHLVFVAKSCKIDGNWPARANELLEGFGMTPQRDTLGTALSKGMRQKTLVAATVLANTPVLLLDEPMIGLDPLGQRELREILRSLRSSGTALMISTHMLEQAQALCDRVIIMKAGKSIAAGTFDELRALAGEGGSAEDLFLELTR